MLNVLRFLPFISVLVFVRPANASPLPGSSWFGVNNEPENRKWLSMIDVDPAKIISILRKHGGLLMPVSCQEGFAVLAKVCRAERVRLNVMERELEVTDFVAQLPGQEEALRIGRVHLHWDSYLKPCVELKVDDVSVLIEFFNILLSDTNWDELSENGFPPSFGDDQPATPKKPRNNNVSKPPFSSFVRVASINLSGNFVVTMKSRPLKKELAHLQFSLDTFDPLDEKIKTQALENLANTGRRGCTTDELYALIQSFMTDILKKFLADIIDDFANDGAKITNQVGNVYDLTKKSVSDYVTETGEWSGRQFHTIVSKRLLEWGLAEAEANSK